MLLLHGAQLDVQDSNNHTPKQLCTNRRMHLLLENHQAYPTKKQKSKAETIGKVKDEIEEAENKGEESESDEEEKNVASLTGSAEKEPNLPRTSSFFSSVVLDDEPLPFEKRTKELVSEFYTTRQKQFTQEYLEKLIAESDTFNLHYRVSGHLRRAGIFVINSSVRFFSLNPIQGTFARYQDVKDFPNKPKQVIHLSEISRVRSVKDAWYTKSGYHYLEVVEGKHSHILMGQNKKIIFRWMRYLRDARELNGWLRRLTAFRHEVEQKELAEQLDNLIHSILHAELFEIELNMDEGREELRRMSSAEEEPGEGEEGANEEGESGSEGEEAPALESSTAEGTMGEENKAEAEAEAEEEEEVSKGVEGGLRGDEEKGIGFSSFELLDVLGQGTFGKVYRVRHKNSEEIYAMKVLRKLYLIKRNQLKYAITECNVLKLANHPCILKLHYSF